MAEPHYGLTNIGRLIGFSYGAGNIHCMDETHGQRVRRLRKALGMTQEDLQEASGVDQSTLSGIEKRNSVPSGDTLVRISKALKTSAEYIMEGTNPVWPFEIVKLDRFLALKPYDRAHVEGKLEAAIESRENPDRSVTLDTAQQQTPPATSGTKSEPVTKSSTFLDGLIGGKSAAGKSGRVSKPGRRKRA